VDAAAFDGDAELPAEVAEVEDVELEDAALVAAFELVELEPAALPDSVGALVCLFAWEL